MSDPKVIYLGPPCVEGDERTWAADTPWDHIDCDGEATCTDPVKYIRADVVAELEAKNKRVREVVLAHCSDLLRCAALLDRYPRFVNTSKEIQKAAMRLVMVLEDE